MTVENATKDETPDGAASALTAGLGEWQPMETAPKDGTVIQAGIPGHGSDNMILWMNGLIDSAGNACGGWAFAYEQEPPSCWTDGICWTANEDGEASVMPINWKTPNV